MRRKSKEETAGGSVFFQAGRVLACLFILIFSWVYFLDVYDKPRGAAILVTPVVIILTIISIKVLISELKIFILFSRKEKRGIECSSDSKKTCNIKKVFKNIYNNKGLMLWLNVLFFLFLTQTTNILIGSLVFLFISLWVLGVREKLIIITVPLGVTLLIYVVFGMLLQIPLPGLQ